MGCSSGEAAAHACRVGVSNVLFSCETVDRKYLLVTLTPDEINNGSLTNAHFLVSEGMIAHFPVYICRYNYKGSATHAATLGGSEIEIEEKR